jgi:NAD-dependent SIR2 family protein deacetylase
MPKRRILILLGAGASAADGAPLQGALFKKFAEQWRNDDGIRWDHNAFSLRNAIPSFFRKMFGIDFYRDNLDEVPFPTVEDVLGVLDFAFAERRGFGAFSYRLGNRPTNSPTIDQMRLIILELISSVISSEAQQSQSVHERLVKNLVSAKLLSDVIFVTTNYDLLIDNALSNCLGEELIDYYGAFEDESLTKNAGNVILLKLHGSLNWWICPSCHTVFRQSRHQCSRCDDFLHPFIVPPTFFKEMGHLTLKSIWHFFEQKLTEVDHIIFCGYSFPDADIHLKYILKRREVLGVPAKRQPLKVSVFNNYPGKTEKQKNEEAVRYKRFFVAPVNYCKNIGFEEFADRPEKFI